MDKLYVVTTGSPGPGVRALIDEVEREALGEDGLYTDDGRDGARHALGLLRDKLRDRPLCEFVEVEDADGRGVRSGAEWERHPGGGGWRLGPFARAVLEVPVTQAEYHLGALHVYVDGPGALLVERPIFQAQAQTDEEFERLVDVLGGPAAARIAPDTAHMGGGAGEPGVLIYAPRAEPAVPSAIARLRDRQRQLAASDGGE